MPFKIEYVSKFEYSVDDAMYKSADDAMKNIEKKRLEICVDEERRWRGLKGAEKRPWRYASW